jgi:uncharacterized membrane protein
MTRKVATTVRRPRDEVERRWRSFDLEIDAAGVEFSDAPGDRGTEIRVELRPRAPLARRLFVAKAREQAKDELRRFKATVETGQVV